MYNIENMKKVLAAVSAFTLLALPVFFLVQNPLHVYAQSSNIAVPLQNPIKYNNFSDFVAAITQTAVQVLMPFVVLAFIYSGFLFVKAQGNPKELEVAQKAIKWSIVGAFILLGAWGFAQIIKTTISTITS